MLKSKILRSPCYIKSTKLYFIQLFQLQMLHCVIGFITHCTLSNILNQQSCNLMILFKTIKNGHLDTEFYLTCLWYSKSYIWTLFSHVNCQFFCDLCISCLEPFPWVKKIAKKNVGCYISRVFLLHQLWTVNYYVKSQSNDLSTET